MTPPLYIVRKPSPRTEEPPIPAWGWPDAVVGFVVPAIVLAALVGFLCAL